jgi:hypothetical protein
MLLPDSRLWVRPSTNPFAFAPLVARENSRVYARDSWCSQFQGPWQCMRRGGGGRQRPRCARTKDCSRVLRRQTDHSALFDVPATLSLGSPCLKNCGNPRRQRPVSFFDTGIVCAPQCTWSIDKIWCTVQKTRKHATGAVIPRPPSLTHSLAVAQHSAQVPNCTENELSDC